MSYGDISSDSSGNFVITWKRLIGPVQETIIFIQRYDSTGNRMGIPVIANDVFRTGIADVNIEQDLSGSFVVSWSDTRNNLTQGKGDIYFQRFDKNGLRIGNNVKVNDDNDTTKEQLLPWLSGDGKGRFAITWTDKRNLFDETSIYFQIYDSAGTPVGSNKRADENTGMTAWSKISMRKDGRFLIGWEDDGYGGRPQYFGRRYKENGDTIGNIYMISQLSPSNTEQRPNDIKILGDRVYAVWEDNRNGDYDIFCNVRSFQNPDSVISAITQISHNIPAEFKLYPAYPNPFNPVSSIKFDIPKESNVIIRIYDLLGREIKTLVDETKQPGSYEISFDGTNFASGVYVYRIEAGSFTDVKKMVLLK